jgi:antitoxin VapB
MKSLNIKDPETVALVDEVAELTGETKTRAVKIALQERRERLKRGSPEDRAERLRRFLETEVRPQIPESERGKPLTKAEREEILGYGPEGY